jgi:hypothetical protein
MMFHIDEYIKSIDGVIDIMPDKTVLKTGKYRVQVSQEKFKTARDSLLNYLPGWCKEYIPVDAYPHPNPYPNYPRVQPIHNDGFSSGENSWMSMSNTSFLSMDLSNVADDDYFSNSNVANKTFTYAEVVLPTNTTYGHFHINSHTDPSEDDTRAAISEITTTVKTDMVQAQLQELEQAKQLIEKQKLEIQKLKEDQDKASENYSNILAMMNDRLQEQDSEAANMKQEISEMIINQQNTHAIAMQDLYDRMMQQMSNMLSLPIHPLTLHTQEDHEDTPVPMKAATCATTIPEYQSKKQDTRPSPMKRKPMESVQSKQHTEGHSSTVQHLEQQFQMDVERESSPIIEDDV